MKSRTAVVLVPIFMILALSVAARVKELSAGPRLAIASLEHSFGTVKPGKPLSYTFKIKNEGQSDLEIKSVSPSCGCTTSNFDKVVAFGKEGIITLAVEKTEVYKGDVVKTATVVTNDPDKQQFVLTLKAFFAAD